LFRIFQLSIIVVLASSFCAAALMNALRLPGGLLPLILALACGLCAIAFRTLDLEKIGKKLTPLEYGLLGYAALIGIVRLIPYTLQYVDHSLVGAANFDDNWHFQELASLVNTERFPPRLNFRPESYLHFYYLPWIPAAALSDALKLVTGQSFIKLTYGLDALLLGLAATFIFILFVRHVLEERARNLPIVAALIAGAAMEGVLLLAKLQGPTFEIDEWWETRFLIYNQFSTWTTLLVWVPHHLISAMALLLAVVVATEPLTLTPRRSFTAQAAAGLLLGFSLFSSIFAFMGGMTALLPLLLRFRGRLEHLAVMGLFLVLPSIPLLYIYLHANSANGFIWLKAFTNWSEKFDFFAAGFVGILVALLLMCMEVGWLFLASVRMDRNPSGRFPLWPLAVASVLFLASTAIISFKGSNNYSMRGAIAPVAILCCYWAEAVARRINSNEVGLRVLPWPRLTQFAFVGALVVACLAHFNEFALHFWSSWRAVRYESETITCKERITAINSGPAAQADVAQLENCRFPGSIYGVERQFEKPTLRSEDEELVGRGP
jgi:hypothetical protein